MKVWFSRHILSVIMGKNKKKKEKKNQELDTKMKKVVPFLFFLVLLVDIFLIVCSINVRTIMYFLETC